MKKRSLILYGTITVWRREATYCENGMTKRSHILYDNGIIGMTKRSHIQYSTITVWRREATYCTITVWRWEATYCTITVWRWEATYCTITVWRREATYSTVPVLAAGGTHLSCVSLQSVRDWMASSKSSAGISSVGRTTRRISYRMKSVIGMQDTKRFF